MPRLPAWIDAPASLVALDDHCGVLATWVVLRHFGVRISAASLLRGLRYSRKWGVFTIGIAVVLAHNGLDVVFHSDPDEDVQPLERALYARARRMGVQIQPAITVSRLAQAIAKGGVPVVFYRTASGEGHFSPVAGVGSRHILLPNDPEGRLSIGRFRRAWRQTGFPQQAVIVRRPV